MLLHRILARRWRSHVLLYDQSTVLHTAALASLSLLVEFQVVEVGDLPLAFASWSTRLVSQIFRTTDQRPLRHPNITLVYAISSFTFDMSDCEPVPCPMLPKPPRGSAR